MICASTWRRRSLRVITVAFSIPLCALFGPTQSYAQQTQLQPGAEAYIYPTLPPVYFYTEGFADLHNQLGDDIMGQPLELEHPAHDAEAVQITSKGLAVWKKGETVAFTNGAETFLLRPSTQEIASASPASVLGPPIGIWDRLAQCESNGYWGTNTGNGFQGGLQFLPSTWRAYGGTAYAPAAHLASRAQQIAIAQRVQAAAGWGQWPACSRRLGLR